MGNDRLDQSQTVICPDCDGKKQVFQIACGPSGSRAGWVDCDRCGGTGEITAEQAGRIAAGRARRQERIARDVSLMEEAKRLGMRPSELSAIERGK